MLLKKVKEENMREKRKIDAGGLHQVFCFRGAPYCRYHFLPPHYALSNLIVLFWMVENDLGLVEDLY